MAGEEDALSKVDSVRSLEDLFSRAVKSGSVTDAQCLADYPEDCFKLRDRAKPSGYAAQTVLHFGGICMPTLLDSCATCSIIPEEVLCIVLEHVRKKLESGEMTFQDKNYPIVAMERYRYPSTVVGVGSGDGAKMEIGYGVFLRAEFVRANFGVGHDSNPIRKLYFKVLPKGTADVPGVLLGYPTLDTAPHGLGWEPKELSLIHI